MRLLEHLERVAGDGQAPRRAAYVRSRAGEVQAHIKRLRRFAALKAGRVQDIVNARADELERRLAAVLT